MQIDQKKLEEEKRRRAMTPAEEWQRLQDFLNWAEANQKPELRRNRPRYRDESGKVHFFNAPGK